MFGFHAVSQFPLSDIADTVVVRPVVRDAQAKTWTVPTRETLWTLPSRDTTFDIVIQGDTWTAPERGTNWTLPSRKTTWTSP